MKPTIEQVASRGMEPVGARGNQSWRPCPACGADKRGRHDPRGPVVLTESASKGPLQGQPAWFCQRCKVGGGITSLARALGHDALDGWGADEAFEPPTDGSPVGRGRAGWSAARPVKALSAAETSSARIGEEKPLAAAELASTESPASGQGSSAAGPAQPAPRGRADAEPGPPADEPETGDPPRASAMPDTSTDEPSDADVWGQLPPEVVEPELFLGAEPARSVLDSEADAEPLDVAAGWAALASKPSTWRARLHRWMQPRGYTREMADTIEASGEIAVVPVGAELRRLPPAARKLVRAIRSTPHDLLFALRSPAGEVVDIERRWLPEHRPPEQSKVKRSPGAKVGKNLGAVMFGRLPDAVAAGMRGEPIIIVEGSTDFVAAYGAVRARRRGAVLGAPGADDLPKVAAALVEALEEADAVPGEVLVHIVPDVGDHMHDPRNAGWRIGERKGWAAAVELLAIARVRWCPPFDRERGDLCDLVLSDEAPIARFWKLIESGQAVLDVGANVDRWRRAGFRELWAHAWRLPLRALLEYLRWYVDTDKDGNAVLTRGRSIRHTRDGDGDALMADSVLRWLAAQGMRFISSDEGLFIWDPVELARKPPHEPGDPVSARRRIPRLVPIGSERYWRGWLRLTGDVTLGTNQGNAIAAVIQGAAQNAPCRSLASWLTADGKLHDPTVRIHTHTLAEDVLTAGEGYVEVQPNGAAGSVLVKASDVERPIEWVQGVGPDDAARLLYAHVARHLTFDAPERTLAVAWLLLAPFRELMRDRPILWATGGMGSGKSFGVAIMNGALYGAPESGTFTTAALWDAGRRDPLVSLDNKENTFIDDKLLELLLTASTGVKRRKRSQKGELGNVAQRFKSLIYITAISRPTRPDLQRRVLLVQHDRRFRNDVHRSAEVLEALDEHRSAIWSGVMSLYAHRIIPRLGRRDHVRFADRIGPDHPIEGMREPLGVMGVIADELCRSFDMWGPGGEAVFDLWLALTARHIRRVRGTSDPIEQALDELLVQWNRRVEDRYLGKTYRPAFSDARFVCRPLYRMQPERRVAGGPWFTLDPDHALKDRSGDAPVLGLVGTYGQLYRDLIEANRYMAAFREAVDSAETLGARIGNVDGWRSELHHKPRRGKRTYRWFRPSDLEDGG